MAGLNYNFSKTNAVKTNEIKNTTDLNTMDLDTLIAKIAQIKAAPVTTEEELTTREAQIQSLVAQRNALANTMWGK